MKLLGRVFWRRSQGELMAPYAQRYLEALPTLHQVSMISATVMSGALYPRAGVGPAFAQQAVAAAKADGVSPGVTRAVIELTDQLNRVLKSRAM
jgi:aminopeptidase N